MFGFYDLKPNLNNMPDRKLECPVRGCKEVVDRPRKGESLRQKHFCCKEHNIYISPTTFEYDKFQTNLLWEFDEGIKAFKRESHRLGRERSEDAVTWNVFRFLELNDLLPFFLASMSKSAISSADTIYWSYSKRDQGTWSELSKARHVFGETDKHGSEPDLIILTDTTLFFIEAKFTSGNKSNGEDEETKEEKKKEYVSGGDNWFRKVFTQSTHFRDIAITEKKYELVRLWLIGTWIAKQLKPSLDFRLVNLVRAEKEPDIETEFGKFIIQDSTKKFMRYSWEDIYRFVAGSNAKDKDIVLQYFEQKTTGYKNGVLQKAFKV